MKRFFRKALSLTLAAALAGSLGLTAAASEALGEDLTAQDTLLNQETALSTNVFWSSAYSDVRTENVITYSPNEDVTPIVTYGDVLTSRGTVSSMARQLEAEGRRVVAGINGDFYNVGTGLPIGLVMTEGVLRSSDAGYYAIGFRADGTAVLGKPGITVTADLGYEGVDSYGDPAPVVRKITAVNKARVSTGGIYLYTYDFNAKHTTGNTEPGVDVVCTVEDGILSPGDTLTLTVDQVLETEKTDTPIGPDQVVLSVNLQSDPYQVDALRNLPVGSTVTITAASATGEWEDVEYAVGALYSLVEYGSVASGLEAGVNPRTAIGQKDDGTLVFYTIDGRRSGHSVGASMTQVAQRMIELGCVTALCLDGGGSTTLSVTLPDGTEAKTVNRPSDGSERSVSNQVFLVADATPTGDLSHFYVTADSQYVLAGSKVNITAAAVDTNFIPMDRDYDLDADGGELDGNVLTTPSHGGEITVTASAGRREGSVTVTAVTDPDAIAIRDSTGAILTGLNVATGSVTPLTGSAAYKHRGLKADPEAFTWTVTGDIGTVDDAGVFTAGAPGTGTLTVSAGGQTASIPVTVSGGAAAGGLLAVETFEGDTTIFRGTGDGMDFSLNHAADTVRLGRGSARVDYTLTEDTAFTAQWRAVNATGVNNQTYTALTVWVYGDGSGNTLSLLYSNGTKTWLQLPVTTLDFTGWKQVTVPTAGEYFSIQGLAVTGAAAGKGTLYLDQIMATAGGADNEAPAVSAALDQGAWLLTASVSDAADGLLPRTSVTVACNGVPMDFTYDEATGAVTAYLPAPGEVWEAMRLTVTARDVSGNIGRASVDVEPLGVDHKFTDIQDYWAATYVDFLYNSGITTGYDDGTFRPNQNITRAQFSVMLYRYLKLDEAKYADVSLPFADNKAIPEYAVPAVKALYTEGIINGTTGKDGKLYFNPGSSLTRAQAATMIGRTQEKGYAAVELTFTDAAAIPGYAAYYIQTMAAQGVLGGYADGTFQPGANITRGQMAKILYNLL